MGRRESNPTTTNNKTFWTYWDRRDNSDRIVDSKYNLSIMAT